jgi:hypothetical protein
MCNFFKKWLPSNYHNFSDGDRSFSIATKGGMPHIFENLSMVTSNGDLS